MAELSGENGLVRGGRRAWGAAAVFLVVLGAGWFAWRGWGGTDGDDAGAFEALQRGQVERCFGGLVPVELGDLAAIERWLSEPECVDCVWLDSEDRRRIMAIVREFLSRRFAGSAEEYVAWRDGLPGRRTTMREQIDDEALPHRRRYQLGRALADDTSFEEVFPVMFDRGITADGRPVRGIRLASGPGAVALAAAEVRASSPGPPRIDASRFGEVWIGSATLSASSWWRPPAGRSYRERLSSGSPFRCVQVGVVLELGSHGRRAFRLRMVETRSHGWTLDSVGYAGLPGGPNFHLEYGGEPTMPDAPSMTQQVGVAHGGCSSAHRGGFTLIELLVGFAILLVLVALLAVVLAPAREAARDARAPSGLSQTLLALGHYAGDFRDVHPYFGRAGFAAAASRRCGPSRWGGPGW